MHIRQPMLAQKALTSAHAVVPQTLIISAPHNMHRRRSLRVCRATSEGDNKITENDKLQVPDTPPAKSSSPPAEEPPQGTSSEEESEVMSVEEIQRRAALFREQNQPAAKDSFVEGVLEEVRLIQWPSPQGAFVNTLYVIAIVASTSALLFAVNTGLTEASKVLYGGH